MKSEEQDPQTYAIIGAAMEVHRQLGPGFGENVYQDAFAIELELRGIPFEREPMIRVKYKGRVLDSHFKPDFVCFENIVVELKALRAELSGTEDSQAINYLKATGIRRALLINFGLPSLRHRRFVWDATEVVPRNL